MGGMSPRAADPAVRGALVDAATELLSEEGPGALTTRRVADQARASTMAVYTHFDGMDQLRLAVAEEGFARLRTLLDKVPDHDDPLSTVAALGHAYLANALDNPHLYRLMFGVEPTGARIGADTFQRLVHAVAEAVEIGLFHGDAALLATQLWAAVHGLASLSLLSALPHQAAHATFDQLAASLFAGFANPRRRGVGGG